MAYEGFRTHTSYLNIQWNNNLIDSWKKTPFKQKDFDYDPSRDEDLTGFKYINDHLGYRFVLRESWLSDTVGEDHMLRAKLRIQNVGFGNLTWKAPVKLAVLEDLDGSGLDMCPMPTYYELSDIDSRNIYSRTISVAGGDTVMTFDGNNELEISVKIKGNDRNRYQVYLKIGEIEFANRVPTGIGSCGEEQPAVYLGKIYVDESVKTTGFAAREPSAGSLGAEKKNAPFVQRERHNAIIRDGEKRYRANGVTSR